jgi:hypothetical protein
MLLIIIPITTSNRETGTKWELVLRELMCEKLHSNTLKIPQRTTCGGNVNVNVIASVK